MSWTQDGGTVTHDRDVRYFGVTFVYPAAVYYLQHRMCTASYEVDMGFAMSNVHLLRQGITEPVGIIRLHARKKHNRTRVDKEAQHTIHQYLHTRIRFANTCTETFPRNGSSSLRKIQQHP
ncbi:hypothetical protein DPSP01_012874 [Paraphaeosphaeria sporulosa]